MRQPIGAILYGRFRVKFFMNGFYHLTYGESFGSSFEPRREISMAPAQTKYAQGFNMTQEMSEVNYAKT